MFTQVNKYKLGIFKKIMIMRSIYSYIYVYICFLARHDISAMRTLNNTKIPTLWLFDCGPLYSFVCIKPNKPFNNLFTQQFERMYNVNIFNVIIPNLLRPGHHLRPRYNDLTVDKTHFTGEG